MEVMDTSRIRKLPSEELPEGDVTRVSSGTHSSDWGTMDFEIPDDVCPEEESSIRLTAAEYSSAETTRELPAVDRTDVALFQTMKFPVRGQSQTSSDQGEPFVTTQKGRLGSDKQDLGGLAERIERTVLRYAGKFPFQALPEVLGTLVTVQENLT